MKILTDREAERAVPTSRARVSPIRRQAFALKLKQSMFVSDKEWKGYGFAKHTSLGSLLYHPKIKFNTRKVIFDGERGSTVRRRK